MKNKYEEMTLAQLKVIAKELAIKNIYKFKKDELIKEIHKVNANAVKKDGVILREKIAPKPNIQSAEVVGKKQELKDMINDSNMAKGILEILENNSFGFLRCKNYLTSSEDIYVSPSQIRRFNLKTGDEILGKVREAKEGEKFKALLYVERVNDEHPEKAIGRASFESLVPIYPEERIKLEHGLDLAPRLMDIICPIGKGQRGIIVAPPKAGKTTLLKMIAQSITSNNPECKLIVLLIDERPEEVTDMQRSINGEVIYSTFDEEPQNHAKISRIVLERAKIGRAHV